MQRTVNKFASAWSKACRESEQNEKALQNVIFNTQDRSNRSKKNSGVPKTQLVFQLVRDYVRSKQIMRERCNAREALQYLVDKNICEVKEEEANAQK